MFPWRRDRRREFFDDFFPDFDEEFQQMEENMARIFDKIRETPEAEGEEKPYVYGFSMRVGPDGKPHIEEFGNVPGMGAPADTLGEGRQPLTDIIEGDTEVTVISEIPGVEKKNIKLESSKKSLTIDVDTAERKYHKQVRLPVEVQPETSKATYKNSVLRVTLKRKGKREDDKKGVNIRVE